MAGGGAGGGVLRELLAVFGFGVDTTELDEGENKLDKFFGKLKELGTALAEIFAVKEVYEFAEAQAKAMTQVERTATALGISTDRVQQFTYASEALGQESGNLLNMMGRLQVVQQAAATGSGQAAEAFRKIGVSVHDSSGKLKTADQLFLDVADGISDTKDASKQAAIATALFGRQGRALLPFLKQGKDGFAELVEEYKALGGGYTEDAIEKSKEFEHQQARMALATRGLKSTIAAQLLPIISKIVSWLALGVAAFRDWVKNSEIVKATLIVLGSAMAYFGLQVLAANLPLILMAAGVAALILLVDSFLVMMEGGQSVIGDAIDAMSGKDAHLEVVRTLKELWDDIGGAIKVAYEYVVKFFSKLTQYGGELGDFLGKLHNMFGSEGEEAERKIEINRVESKRKADATTAETRRRVAERLDREVLGQGSTSPLSPIASDSPAYVPPNFAPLVGAAPPANAQGNMVMQEGDITVNLNVPPGHDEKKTAQLVADEVRKQKKQANRATAATFQRLNPSGSGQ